MPNNVECMVFSPDSRWLVSLGAQGQVLVHRVDSAKGDYDLIPPGETTQVAFSPDGRHLACATYTPRFSLHSSRLFVYELASKKICLDLIGHSDGAIDRLAFSHDGGLLASGAIDTTVLVWNAGLRAFASRPSDKDATAAELADWLQQMAGADAKAAFQHMIKLANRPTQAVKLLDGKIASAKKPDGGEKTVAQWIQDLGSPNFGVRGKANAMLQKLGRPVGPDLLAALPTAKDVETKRRIEELLDGILALENTPAEILHIRAVEVLEASATPDARDLLTRWSAGDSGAVLTVESRQALARMNYLTKAEK